MSVNSTRNSEMVEALSADFRRLYNPAHAFADATAMLQMLPGLVGLWPSSVFGGGAANTSRLVDISGNGLHMTRVGATFMRISALAPSVQYDGGYYSLADSPLISITGLEPHIGFSQKGLTVLAWVKFDNAASGNEYIASKMGSGSTDLSWGLRRLANGSVLFEIYQSAAGTTPANTITSTGTAIDAQEWTFVAGRFKPSTEVKLWVNDVTFTGTTSIISSISDGTAVFNIAARSGTFLMDGNVSMLGMAAANVPDDTIEIIYEMTAPMYKASL